MSGSFVWGLVADLLHLPRCLSHLRVTARHISVSLRVTACRGAPATDDEARGSPPWLLLCASQPTVGTGEQKAEQRQEEPLEGPTHPEKCAQGQHVP